MKVISCFSYKGGAGRTVAAANIAAALASSQVKGVIRKPLNFKVAIIDLDVFSAGTHRGFDISNKVFKDDEETGVKGFRPTIQDYLLHEMKASEYVETGGVTLGHDMMANFRGFRGADKNCNETLTLFPAKPEPDRKFNVQKYHENQLLGLILELERKKYDYVIIDGEAGTRSMADVSLRLADIVLMFFRLTFQHIEGTLAVVEKLKSTKPCYLIPTCVPVASIYQVGTPGLKELVESTRDIPAKLSDLNKVADEDPQGLGYFWSQKRGRQCIHDSLFLKGAERVLVYHTETQNDPAAADYYTIASEIPNLK
jgi:cellulose biosynthesis protein BcsQ